MALGHQGHRKNELRQPVKAGLRRSGGRRAEISPSWKELTLVYNGSIGRKLPLTLTALELEIQFKCRLVELRPVRRPCGKIANVSSSWLSWQLLRFSTDWARPSIEFPLIP